MGSASGNGMFLKGNNSRNARKVICLVVSAVALLTILAPVLTADVSSADTDTSSEFTIKFVNQRGAEITTPLFTDSVLSFDTETTENGLLYSFSTGNLIDSIPAYFVIQSKQKLDGNLFKVSVSLEGLAPWMDSYGIRVVTDEGGTADLRKGNSYESVFMSGGKEVPFQFNKKYSISFYTLEGVKSMTPPGDMSNITVNLEAEIIPGLHNIQFLSPNAEGKLEVVTTRALYEYQQLGILPLLGIQGNTFLGWFDSEDKEVFATTLVSDLPSDIITAKWEWPHVDHWTETINNPDGSVTVVDYTKLTYQDQSTKTTIIETTTYPDGKKEREESTESVDPEGNVTDDSMSNTDITTHDDGSETWNTDEKKNNSDGTSEEYKIVTEYDPDGNMVVENKEAKLIDADKNSREYSVSASLTDEKEMRYRVEAIIPETTILDIDNAKKLIDNYDYNVAVVGTHSDTGLIIVPEDVMTEVAIHGYYLSVSNDEQYVAVDDNVVSSLAREGGEVRLWITPDIEGKVTEEQKSIIGNNYAFSVTLTVDGRQVTELDGYAEISLDPELIRNGKVLLINDDGTIEELPVHVDPYTGKVTYMTNHLSIFMVVEEDDGNEFAIPWVLFTLSEFLIIPVVYYIYHRRRKQKA